MWRTDFRNEIAASHEIESFSICCLVREKVTVLQRFVEHHQRAGVEHVYLYFDGSQEETRPICEAFKTDKSVSVKCCDSTYWSTNYPGKSKIDLPDKRLKVFTECVDQNTSDWLLICDADEFVVADRPLGSILAQLPKETLGVRIPNSEAVWGPEANIHEEFGCDYERHPFPTGYWGKAFLPLLVYGRDWSILGRGVTGHREGKHLLRKGMVPDVMTSHWSKFDGKKIDFMPSGMAEGSNLRIVHFDAVGYERWKDKWCGRISGRAIPRTRNPMRLKQWKMIEKALSDGQGEDVFRRICTLNRWQVFVLKCLGLLSRIEN